MLKNYPVTRSDADWRRLLTPEQVQMMREQGAERPGTSALVFEKRPGPFSCVGCDSPLFEGKMKFESGTGWPSFKEPIARSVDTIADDTYLGGHHAGYGTIRTEVCCATCGSHLGHIFSDGPPPTGQRYCINGVALKFTPSATEQDRRSGLLRSRRGAAPHFCSSTGAWTELPNAGEKAPQPRHLDSCSYAVAAPK